MPISVKEFVLNISTRIYVTLLNTSPATGYGLEVQNSISNRGRNFCFCRYTQTDSNSMCTRVKVAGVWGWLMTDLHLVPRLRTRALMTRYCIGSVTFTFIMEQVRECNRPRESGKVEWQQSALPSRIEHDRTSRCGSRTQLLQRSKAKSRSQVILKWQLQVTLEGTVWPGRQMFYTN
jgi:hypothetical protein